MLAKSKFVIKFNALICVVAWAKTSRTTLPNECWNALFLVAEKLAIAKNFESVGLIANGDSDTLISKAKQPESNASEKDIEIGQPILIKTKIGIHTLPTELHLRILDFLLPYPSSLHACSLLSRHFYYLCNPIMYNHPTLLSSKSIELYLHQIQQTSNWKAAATHLSFSPTLTGSLLEHTENEEDIDGILRAHSCLFRMMVHERKKARLPTPNPLFYTLASRLPHLVSVNEVNVVMVRRPTQPIADPFVNTIPAQDFSSSKSQTILTQLLEHCKKISELKEWAGVSVDSAISVCVLLLDAFEGEFRPIWKRVGSDTIRQCRTSLMNKCKIMLNYISAGLLLEVRYVTIASQGILNAFCLVYYAALGISHTLDFEYLIGCFVEKPPVPKYRRRRPQSSQSRHNQTVVNLLQTTSINETNPNQAQEPIPKKYQRHQLAAIKIYEAIAILFNLPLPDFSKTPPFDPENLRSLTFTFPPPGLTEEKIELLRQIVHIDIRGGKHLEEFKKWRRWLRIAVRWYRTSRQTEPVKEMLRMSMAKIDGLRSMQVI